MSEIGHLASTIYRRAAGSRRFVVGIAGAPGSGKSTLAQNLAEIIAPSATVAVVPMDGFHYDNAILTARGHLDRKGAPHTFDVGGFSALLARLRQGGADVAVPLFDRTADLVRGSAAIVAADTRFVLVEGNYLLLDEAPWNALAPHFDITVFVEVPKAELARRLVQRWLDHGIEPEAARSRAFSNDMPNAELVADRSRQADITLRFARPERDDQA